jgi:hypothetical protein
LYQDEDAYRHWWNDADRGKMGVVWEKNCLSDTLYIINLTWTGSGSNPGLRGERATTNPVGNVTALLDIRL